jgi:hypothetical protein
MTRWHVRSLVRQLCWPAGFMLLLAVAVTALAVWSLGCTRSDQQRVLTVMTDAAWGAHPMLSDTRDEEELACFDGEPTFATAKQCVVNSRAKWSSVWGAYDVLVAVDRAAIDGEPNLAMALGAYCVLAPLAGLPSPETFGLPRCP